MQLQPCSQSAVQFYESGAPSYVAACKGRAPAPSAVWLAHQLSPGDLVVDAGCGTGVESAYFSSKGFQVYAYDASAAMVSEAQTVINARCPAVHQHGHAELNLAQPAQAILACASLLFLAPVDLAAALRNLGDNLAPGGLLVALFKAGTEVRDAGDGRTFHDKLPADLGELASQAGLSPVTAFEERDQAGRAQNWTVFVMERPVSQTSP